MNLYGYRKPDGHVFVTYAGEPLGEKFLTRIIRLICEKEKLSHFTPHYLRHTFVSILFSQNIPITTIAALVDDTPETIYKVYAHSFDKDEENAVKLLNDLITINSFEGFPF